MSVLQYEKGGIDVRGEDVKHARAFVAKLLNGMKTLHRTDDPVLDPDSRTNRGWAHFVTGLLLCPIDWNWFDDRFILFLFRPVVSC